MKINIIGIIGGVLAFVSLALPWWTMAISSALGELGSISLNVLVYPYMASMGDLGSTAAISLWYGWIALALIIVGGALGIAGSLKPDKAKIVAYGGALAVVSIIIFAVGLQLDFLSMPTSEGYPTFALFGSSTVSESGYELSYFAYLSFGFWIALVAAILMFVASRKKPAPVVAAPPPPPPSVVYQ